MQVHFTFRHVEPSDAVKNYAKEKIAKFQKFLRSPLEADVILWTERHLQCVELSVRGDGEHFVAKVDSEDMYASIDLVIDKIDRQIREDKHASTASRKHSGGVAQMSGKTQKD